MRIGKFSVLVIVILLFNSCGPNTKWSRIVIEVPSYEQEIQTLLQNYVAAINAQDWINALNQRYIARCNADSVMARTRYLKYFQDGRLTSSMELESLDFETHKISTGDLEFSLFNFTFKLDIEISEVPYSNAQLKENYLAGLRHLYGADISISDTDDNSIQVGNLTQTLLAVNNYDTDCQGWKIVSFTDASKYYFDTVFDIDISNLIASNQR